MCDKPFNDKARDLFSQYKREPIGDDPVMDKELREKAAETSTTGNDPKQTEEPMEAKFNSLLDESKEVLAGVAIGTAYGCVISTVAVASSTAKILFYPVYLANAAVRPFVDLVVAPAYPVVFGFLGGIVGLGAKLAKDA